MCVCVCVCMCVCVCLCVCIKKMNIPIHWNSEPLVDIIKDPAIKIINLHCKTVIKVM